MTGFAHVQIPEVINSQLLEYQRPHTRNLIHSLDLYRRVLDASDTGTGKTYTAIAACLTLNLKPLIVCPKSVLNNWKRVLTSMECKYYGLTNYESFQNVKMFTMGSPDEALRCLWLNRNIEEPIEKTPKPASNQYSRKLSDGEPEEKIKQYYTWTNYPADIVVIIDEAHRCKNPNTLNHLILKSIAQTDTRIMLLSATVSDKPKNFALVGYVLRLYPNLKDCQQWIDKNSQGHQNPMMGVWKQIIPEYMCRMSIKDLGDAFPRNQMIASCYDMDTANEIEKQYKLIAIEVEKLKEKEGNACGLAAITYARMKIEQFKIPTILEMAKKYLSEGNSIVIFVNFTMTLKTLAQELQTNCLIYGEQNTEERTQNVDDFNYDRSQIILVNIKSGGAGISLHDTNGNFPRISIISPSWSAIDILQALGRIHRANGKTPTRQRIIYCKGTVEEDICDKMKEKIQSISSLNEGRIDNYQIEGLIAEQAEEEELSEFEMTFLKIRTLHSRRDRLEQDLRQVQIEINEIEQSLYQLI